MTIRSGGPCPLTRTKLTDFRYLIANVFAPFILIYLLSRFIERGDTAVITPNFKVFQIL